MPNLANLFSNILDARQIPCIRSSKYLTTPYLVVSSIRIYVITLSVNGDLPIYIQVIDIIYHL